jgi:hypothetical protein
VLDLGSHPHKSLSKLGRNLHCSAGIRPSCPAVSNIEHGSVGCEGNSKIASGIPTANPSPHTLHTFPASVVGAAITGESTGAGTGAFAGPGAGAAVTCEVGANVAAEEGDDVPRMGMHPHTSTIKSGSNSH